MSWYVLLDPVFASFALVSVVSVNLCPLPLFAICDYLVITLGLDFPMSGLDFYSFITLVLRLFVLRLPHFGIILFSLCLSMHLCYLLGSARVFSVSRLMIDFIYVSELLYNDFCHR